LLSHHVTFTLFPFAVIFALSDLTPLELLRFIFSPKVCPPSVDVLNIISESPASDSALVHHTTYMFCPEVAIRISGGRIANLPFVLASDGSRFNVEKGC
jgi:hypothetical protein